MAKQNINIGTVANDGTGDTIRDAFDKVNDNTTELYNTKLEWVSVPSSKTAAGTAGQIAKDSNYLYVCTATNTWARVPIATNWT